MTPGPTGRHPESPKKQPLSRAIRAWATTLLTSDRHRWVLVWPFLLALAIALAGANYESDPYWGARAGWENLTGTPMARPDSWSWYAHGMWYPNSPLWNIVLGAGWHLLGYWGFFLIAVMSSCTYFALAWSAARSLGARWLPGLIGISLPLLLAVPFLSVRATLVVQSLLLGSVLFAFHWSHRAAQKTLGHNVAVTGLVGAGFSVVGNWVHLSFMATSALIAAIWAVIWFMTPKLNLRTRVVMAAGGAGGLALGCFFSPFGIPVTLARSVAVRGAVTGLYVEWQSVATAPGIARQLTGVAVALILAISGPSVWRGVRRIAPQQPDARLLVPLWLVSSLTFAAGFDAVRFTGVALLTSIPIAAALATQWVDRVRSPRPRSAGGARVASRLAPYLDGRFWVSVLVVAGAILVPGLTAAGVAAGAKPQAAAIAAEIPPGCRLITNTATAAIVLLVRADVTVWIDGRADFYGRDHILRDRRIAAGDETIPTAAECAVYPISDDDFRPVVNRLDRDPQWVRIAELDGFVLWARR